MLTVINCTLRESNIVQGTYFISVKSMPEVQKNFYFKF